MTGLRVITAVILGALLLGIIVLAPPLWTVLVIDAAVLIGAWEWSAFLRVRSCWPRAAYVLLTGLLLWFVSHWGMDPVVRGAILVVAALWWCTALAWIALAPHRVTRATAALAGWLTLVPAGLGLLQLRLGPGLGLRWLLYVLFLVWTADTGAYFAGRAFGTHKLAPQVSPGKTWEGALGGLVLVAALGALAAPQLGKPAFSFAVVSVVIGAFSIVGDLSESMFKRYAGLKDSGHLIPGHGGLMDRIDSITAAAPLLLLASAWPGAVTP